MKTLIVLAAFVMSSVAVAKPADVKKYKEAFPGKDVSCKTCHTKGKELNAYGTKVKEAGGDLKKVGAAE